MLNQTDSNYIDQMGLELVFVITQFLKMRIKMEYLLCH